MAPEPSSVERARELLKQLWHRHKDTIFERLDALEAASARAATLDVVAREEARSVAHKLAGSLGTFGFQEGTDLARDSETILSNDAISAADQQRLVANAAKIRTLLERES